MENRFDYFLNIQKIADYVGYENDFWPLSSEYALCCIDLTEAAKAVDANVMKQLVSLGDIIESEWTKSKRADGQALSNFNNTGAISQAMLEVATCFAPSADRQAIELRAKALAVGYSPQILKELLAIHEECTVVAGLVSTWYGKQKNRMPTAFACGKEQRKQEFVEKTYQYTDQVQAYLKGLHTDLSLSEPPVFSSTNLFFMAGEGNRHPKHIAYFLPGDEGVSHSDFRKTCYFSNVHLALIECFATPLAKRHLNLKEQSTTSALATDSIPVLGVFGHELGHFIFRPEKNFQSLNKKNRWVSVALQEVVADVFGILILAEVWAEHVGVTRSEVIQYYLSECLRYVDRGLGYFPDSDGMFLQLNYLVQFGALTLEGDDNDYLTGQPEVVIAGLRSLARVLADSVLNGDEVLALALYKTYGPENRKPVQSLLNGLVKNPPKALAYHQG
ncbi:hypothetical protein [Pseudomonas sp. S2_H01]